MPSIIVILQLRKQAWREGVLLEQAHTAYWKVVEVVIQILIFEFQG